jgi:NAD(P)-dependent dehydrogenase (short-subunit alcohol dehydrogenase family)
VVDTNKLDGKVAVVTGAGRGIGQAEALGLAEAGARVVVNDLGCDHTGLGRDPQPADETVDMIKQAGGEAIADHGDMSVMAEADALVNRALETYGRLDIVVNNAGTVRTGRIAETSEEIWDSLIANHLRAHFCVSRHAARIFTEQRSGRLINTSSEAGLGMAGFGAYGAAKEGITGLTRTLHLELSRHGATVNSIRPRAYTRMFPISVQAGIEMGELLTDTLPDATGAGLFDQTEAFGPEQVAALVVYLAGDDAVHVSGQDFIVGGGTVSLLLPPTVQQELALEPERMSEQLRTLLG